MANNDCDIVIAGGGMVGASLALLLSRYSQDRLKIVVVERFTPPQHNAPAGLDHPVFQPSFDARSTALSFGSRLIFESLDIWAALEQHISPINSIHVGEQGRFGSVLMDRSDVDWPALGYVIENAWLGSVLYSVLRSKENITFQSPATVSSIDIGANGANVSIECADGDRQVIKPFKTQLAVVADGANSQLRKQLGIAATTRHYRQTAVIANVSFSQSHNGRAYERFTDEGPIALLPLTDSEQGVSRAAVVWSVQPERADELISCDDNLFLQQLQRSFGRRLGEFTRVGERACYPLALVEATEQVRRAIVVMGNAAHSLHPVAGQGFNLALRDCARLAKITANNLLQGIALGDLTALTDYQEQQRFDQQKTVVFSDRLPALFASQVPGISCLRALGLAMLDVFPAAKEPFIYQAAGLHDGAPF